MRQTQIGIVLYMILIIPLVISKLESIMILHMLVQLPLLITAGWLFGKVIIEKYSTFFNKSNANGIPGMLFIVIVTSYWMFPRVMDEALDLWTTELFKFIVMPLVGFVLRDSWNKMQGVGKSFIFLNYISMFGLMGWLYLDSPIQLCNNYLETEQKRLGAGFLGITAAMVIHIIHFTFTDHSEKV